MSLAFQIFGSHPWPPNMQFVSLISSQTIPPIHGARDSHDGRRCNQRQTKQLKLIERQAVHTLVANALVQVCLILAIRRSIFRNERRAMPVKFQYTHSTRCSDLSNAWAYRRQPTIANYIMVVLISCTEYHGRIRNWFQLACSARHVKRISYRSVQDNYNNDEWQYYCQTENIIVVRAGLMTPCELPIITHEIGSGGMQREFWDLI